jgi:hypothetical protein
MNSMSKTVAVTPAKSDQRDHDHEKSHQITSFQTGNLVK